MTHADCENRSGRSAQISPFLGGREGSSTINFKIFLITISPINSTNMESISKGSIGGVISGSICTKASWSGPVQSGYGPASANGNTFLGPSRSGPVRSVFVPVSTKGNAFLGPVRSGSVSVKDEDFLRLVLLALVLPGPIQSKCYLTHGRLVQSGSVLLLRCRSGPKVENSRKFKIRPDTHPCKTNQRQPAADSSCLPTPRP